MGGGLFGVLGLEVAAGGAGVLGAKLINCRPYVPGWQNQPDSAEMW